MPKKLDVAQVAHTEQGLRAQTALQPNNAMAWQQLAGLLVQLGRSGEAAEAFARATAAGASA